MSAPAAPMMFYAPSTTLYHYARVAAQTIEGRALPDARSPDQHEALVAVMFSCFALEGFVNEVGDYAAYLHERNPGSEPREITQLGAVLQALKEQRAGGSVETKYMMAKWVLDGTPYDRGAAPYQDFALLVQLRNTIVHVQGVELYEITPAGPAIYRENPRIIERLEALRVLAPEIAGGPARQRSWLERLWTLAAAYWACHSSSAMIRSLIAVMPDTPFGAFWRGVYDHFYRLADGPPRFRP